MKSTFDSLMDGLLEVPYFKGATPQEKRDAVETIIKWIDLMIVRNELSVTEAYHIGRRSKWADSAVWGIEMTPEDALTRYHEIRAKINGEQNELTEFSLREKLRVQNHWQQKRRQLPKAKVPAGTVCNGCGLELAEGTRASRAKNITHAHGDYVWGYVYYCETCTGVGITK